jgi:16S rRNA (cytosine967-C5)-methyltransferase
LQGASVSVKKGGVLIYSVCSQEKEETSEVMEKFLAGNPNFAREEFIFTDMPDVDNFFVAKLKKIES